MLLFDFLVLVMVIFREDFEERRLGRSSRRDGRKNKESEERGDGKRGELARWKGAMWRSLYQHEKNHSEMCANIRVSFVERKAVLAFTTLTALKHYRVRTTSARA